MIVDVVDSSSGSLITTPFLLLLGAVATLEGPAISLKLPMYNKHHHNHLRRVEHLEFDKVAQALEITKLKRRVKKLERRNKVRVLKLRRLQRVGTSQRVETTDETVMDDVSNQGRMIAKVDVDADADVVLENVKEAVDEAKEVAEDTKVNENVDIQVRQAESQAEIYKIDLDHANKVLSMQEDGTKPAKVQEVVDVVITANLARNVDSPTKFYMYPHIIQLMIRKQVGNLLTHTTKHTSHALTQKVFSEVETPLFKRDVSAAHGEVPTVVVKPSIPSPTPPTPPPQPSQDIP
nr:hypothetical protein [Tanacetum cinerariifolium]